MASHSVVVVVSGGDSTKIASAEESVSLSQNLLWSCLYWFCARRKSFSAIHLSSASRQIKRACSSIVYFICSTCGGIGSAVEVAGPVVCRLSTKRIGGKLVAKCT